MESVLAFFPSRIRRIILEKWSGEVEEIRVRALKPIALKCSNYEVLLDCVPSQSEILEILQFLCDNSVYSFQNQICNRFYYC